jgi:hypothetical protein
VNAWEEWDGSKGHYRLFICHPVTNTYSRHGATPDAPHCKRYQQHDWPEHQFETGAWWISGGKKLAKVWLDLVFSNGQTASPDTGGQFIVERPTVVDFQAVSSGVRFLASAAGHILGVLTPTAGNGMEWTVSVQRSESFFGRVIHTQLVRRDFSWWENGPLGIPVPGSDDTDAQFWLDNQEWYLGRSAFFNPGGVDTKIYNYDDGPSLEGDFRDYVDLRDEFIAYVRYSPQLPESIFVTIGRIEWSWHGRAEEDSGMWTLTVTNLTGPTTNWADDSFPEWDRVYENN